MVIAALALTLATYAAATRLRGVPPVLTAAVALALMLGPLGIAPEAFARGTAILVALLAPAIVALAIPLIRARRTLAAAALPALCGIAAGTLTALIVAVLVGHALHVPADTLRSLAPRAATSPVAAAIASSLGGDAHLAAAASVAGAILATLFAPLLLRVAGARAGGIAMGVSAHAIGTARANAFSADAGAAATAATTLNAILTAVAAPLVLHLMHA